MSLVGSSLQKQPLQASDPSTNPWENEIKGSNPDGPAKLAKLPKPGNLDQSKKVMPIEEAISILRAYQNQDKQEGLKKEKCAEIGQVILDNSQGLSQAVEKDPALGALLASVGIKYIKEVEEGKSDSKSIERVCEAFRKINIAILPAKQKELQAHSHSINGRSKELQKMFYEGLPATGDDVTLNSLNSLRGVIKDDPKFGYECLASWISIKRVDIVKLKLSKDELSEIAPYLTHVTIGWDMEGWTDEDYNSFIDSCPNLISLDIRSYKLTQLWAKQFQKLRHLRIYCEKITALPAMPELESLNCICYQLRALPLMPALKSFDMNALSGISPNDPVLNALAPQLTHLVIGGASGAWDHVAYDILLKKCTRLEKLEVGGNTITDLILLMPSLHTFVSYGLPVLKTLSPDLPALRMIDIGPSVEVNKEALLALAPQLEDVTLDSIGNWNKADYLAFINSCTKLKRLTLKTHKITILPPGLRQVGKHEYKLDTDLKKS